MVCVLMLGALPSQGVRRLCPGSGLDLGTSQDWVVQIKPVILETKKWKECPEKSQISFVRIILFSKLPVNKN